MSDAIVHWLRDLVCIDERNNCRRSQWWWGFAAWDWDGKTSIGFFRFSRQTMSESVNVTESDLLFFNWNDSDVEVWVISLENKKLNEIQ